MEKSIASWIRDKRKCKQAWMVCGFCRCRRNISTWMKHFLGFCCFRRGTLFAWNQRYSIQIFYSNLTKGIVSILINSSLLLCFYQFRQKINLRKSILGLDLKVGILCLCQKTQKNIAIQFRIDRFKQRNEKKNKNMRKLIWSILTSFCSIGKIHNILFFFFNFPIFFIWLKPRGYETCYFF